MCLHSVVVVVVHHSEIVQHNLRILVLIANGLARLRINVYVCVVMFSPVVIDARKGKAQAQTRQMKVKSAGS